MSTSLIFTLGKVSIAIVGLLITALAWQKAKANRFYEDTFWLIPLGVFVWGDGLILGPFWLVSGLLFFLLSPVMVLRYVLLFAATRAGYEVIYWLAYQATGNNTFETPLFRRIKWLQEQKGAILYQLITTVWFFFALFGLLATFG